MEDVRTRLNSHPIPTLRKILSATAKFVNIKGGFSRTLKTKKDIVDYMIELEKDMPEVSWDKIPLKDKPKKEKAPPKIKVDLEKAKKAGIKVDEKSPSLKIVKKKAPAKPKEEKAPAKPKKKISKAEAKAIADSLDKPSKKSLIEQLQDLPDFPNPTNVPKKKPKKKVNFKLKADVNCNKAKNNSQSIISLYEKHGGVIKNSDFSSRKDLNEAIELVNTFVNDSRCNANEKAIMKKALKLHAENPKAKAKVPKN